MVVRLRHLPGWSIFGQPFKRTWQQTSCALCLIKDTTDQLRMHAPAVYCVYCVSPDHPQISFFLASSALLGCFAIHTRNDSSTHTLWSACTSPFPVPCCCCCPARPPQLPNLTSTLAAAGDACAGTPQGTLRATCCYTSSMPAAARDCHSASTLQTRAVPQQQGRPQ